MDSTEVRETGMSTSREPLPESITSLLDTLRGRIRRYVLIEGFATILIWLALVFWVGLALDYVPVTFGASEMPVEARIVLLGIAGLGTLWILYRLVLSRLWVSMPYRSLALLIERRYPQLGECLLTTVEAAESPHAVADAYEQQMLDKTRHDALAALPEIKISELFDPTPLWRKGLGAAFALVTIGVFALVAFASFQIWVSRLALNDQAWPRLARMEVLGLEILERDNDGSSEGSTTVLLPFQDKVVKIARGSSVRLLAAADTDASYVPRYATLVYRTADGLSDSVRMQRMGTAAEDEQLPFVYDRKPLIGMANSLEFDVIGYDHKLSGYRIEVVDRPFITNSEVDAVLPEYTELLPRKEVVSGATQLPVGSEVTLTMTTSKPIVSAKLFDLSTQETTELTFDPPVTTIEQQYASLSRDLPLEVSLVDVDGIANEIPYRLKISAAPDMPPAVEMRPIGIGSAITKDARIQLAGRIQDDFGVARSWVEIQVVGGAALEVPLRTDAEGNFATLIDLKEQQTPDGILRVEADDKLIIAVLAQDKCDLDGEGNIGTADRLQLDVVTPDKLLSLLEGRELDLRRRFEQIRDETVRLREDFTRIQIDAKRFTLGAKEFAPKNAPSEEAETTVNAEDLFRKALDLQRLRIQRAYQAPKMDVCMRVTDQDKIPVDAVIP